MNELVIARYEENLVWLAAVPSDWRVRVYNKGVTVPAIPRAGTVTPLPNVGREGETFLAHVIDQYDNLADVTLFAQGNPFDHMDSSAFFGAFSGEFTGPSAPVGRWHTCDSTGYPNHPGLPLVDVASAMGVKVLFPLGFPAGAMWRVKKETIRRRPKWFYQNLREVLLLNEINGYCLERFWTAIWDYRPATHPPTTAQVFGLLYTHHKVPDKVLAQCLASIRAMGLSDEQLVISCQRDDDRLPERARKVFRVPADQNWLPAILEQMVAGLEVLPAEAKVLTLEHDVLYPQTYLDTMDQAITDQGVAYYYTLVRHLDLRAGERADFWASDPNGTRTLQSCCGGRVATLLNFARADLAAWRSGTYTKAFELGIDGHWRRVDADQPVLDLRCGTNSTSTGYDADSYFAAPTNTFWGQAQLLRKRLMA